MQNMQHCTNSTFRLRKQIAFGWELRVCTPLPTRNGGRVHAETPRNKKKRSPLLTAVVRLTVQRGPAICSMINPMPAANRQPNDRGEERAKT